MGRNKKDKPTKPENKGMNGYQEGQQKLAEFLQWVAEVEHAGSKDQWKGRFAGTMSREKIARKGLGWDYKAPFYQNDDLKKVADQVERKWFGGPDKQSVEAVNAALDRSRKLAQIASADCSQLAVRLAEAEAELRILRKMVRAFQEQRELIAGGVPGFELPAAFVGGGSGS